MCQRTFCDPPLIVPVLAAPPLGAIGVPVALGAFREKPLSPSSRPGAGGPMRGAGARVYLLKSGPGILAFSSGVLT